MATTATPDGNDHVRIDGEKTWISNGGIADHYVVFARSGRGAGCARPLRLLVEADTPGLSITERIDVIAPHPLATLRFEACRVPVANRIGGPGDGFKVAMATLDIFRSTVGAAALGFARRALHETVSHANGRKLFGGTLGDLQLSPGGHRRQRGRGRCRRPAGLPRRLDQGSGRARVTREAALAKLVATENAQRVIDRAVQIHGGLGVTRGVKVEELYREIRALRIYEGATEVQKVVIARDLLKAHADKTRRG
jgi:acyl-CoA dehydrogenase